MNDQQKTSPNSQEVHSVKTISFEKALERLEAILEKINSGHVSLEESLILYEEADALITHCNLRLTEAEQKIEILIKNRQGEVLLNTDQKPITQEFISN